MPFSYNGVGPVAILTMIVSLIIGEFYKKCKHRRHHH
jgi:hypothetical protein